MNQFLLLLWLDQESREARILRCGASQDWEIRTELVLFFEGEFCLIIGVIQYGCCGCTNRGVAWHLNPDLGRFPMNMRMESMQCLMMCIF
jgi:hypothetical protein